MRVLVTLKPDNKLEEVIIIISYDGFWKVLKERGISQYKLIMQHGVSNSQLNHIRKGGHITTATINKLCKLLDCEIGDIVAYVPDGDETEDAVAASLFLQGLRKA